MAQPAEMRINPMREPNFSRVSVAWGVVALIGTPVQVAAWCLPFIKSSVQTRALYVGGR